MRPWVKDKLDGRDVSYANYAVIMAYTHVGSGLGGHVSGVISFLQAIDTVTVTPDFSWSSESV